MSVVSSNICLWNDVFSPYRVFLPIEKPQHAAADECRAEQGVKHACASSPQAADKGRCTAGLEIPVEVEHCGNEGEGSQRNEYKEQKVVGGFHRVLVCFHGA